MTPTLTDHGLAFVAWAVSLGHLRRLTLELDTSTGEWNEISNRLERWCPSEQVYPTGLSMKGYLESAEWKKLFDKWTAVFEEDGGANGTGVSVVAGVEGAKRKAELRIDLEVSSALLSAPTTELMLMSLQGCPELWKYSKIWSNRDPETGKFK